MNRFSYNSKNLILILGVVVAIFIGITLLFSGRQENDQTNQEPVQEVIDKGSKSLHDHTVQLVVDKVKDYLHNL